MTPSVYIIHNSSIDNLEKLMELSIEELQELHERYVFLSHDENTNSSLVAVHELIKGDVDVSHLNYPQGKMDLVIVDPEVVRDKLVKVLNFAFDKLYKTDEIEIRFKKSDSAVTSIIYETAWMFDVIDQHLEEPCSVLIKRRDNDG